MRKRITQIARGKFDTVIPEVAFSENPVSFQVIEGRSCDGQFVMTCENDAVLRGMVYCTDPRMTILNSRFEGQQIRIGYHYDGKGLAENEVVNGEFVIICNDVNYRLPYDGSVTRLYYESSIGMIRNLDDFARLADHNWKEAVRFLHHPAFTGVLRPEQKREMMIYRGLVGSGYNNQNLEEFLIAIGKKERIRFALEEKEAVYHEVTEARREGVILRRDGWGYLEIEVSAEGSFLQLTKKTITSEDFIGGSFRYEFLLRQENMHSGNNYGRITFRSPYQTVVLEVCADREVQLEEVMDSADRLFRRAQSNLAEAYRKYRMKQIPIQIWSRNSIDALSQMYALDKQPSYDLMKAYIYYQNHQKQEAEAILRKFVQAHCDEERNSQEWALWYLVSLRMEKSSQLRNDYRNQISRISQELEEDDLVYMIWFDTNTDPKKPEERFRLLKERYQQGHNSVYLIMEAGLLLLANGELLKEADDFELLLLKWAHHHKLLNRSVAGWVFKMAAKLRRFQTSIYHILCSCYELDHRKEHLAVICRYLIQGQCFKPQYLEWYEKAMEEEIRINGLYEAYLLSADEDAVLQLPRILQVYFQYDNTTLPYQKLALLYRNITDLREKDPDLFEKYSRRIGHFALEHAQEGHMSANLAAIYEAMIEPSLLQPKLARSMAKLLYTCRLRVSSSSIVKAILYQWQLKEPVVAMVAGREAYLERCSDDYVVILEDHRGRRFAGSISYELERLMNPDAYLSAGLSMAPDELNYVIHGLGQARGRLIPSVMSPAGVDRLFMGEEVSPAYQAYMQCSIIRYYQDLSRIETVKRRQENEKKIRRYLLIADMSCLSREDRSFLMERMVSCEMYDLVYERMQEYGCSHVEPVARAKVAGHVIRKLEGEKDEQLLSIALSAFLDGEYTDDVLFYLNAYYAGPLPEMLRLWRHAVSNKLRTYELEERILITALYCGTDPSEVTEVFYSYADHNGRDLIINAFLSRCSQEYFVRGRSMEEQLFTMLYARMRTGAPVSDACKLAWLKHKAGARRLEDEEYRMEDLLLEEMISHNLCFAMFRRMDPALVRKYHLDDKVILEHHTRPQLNVSIHVSRDEDGARFTQEEMKEMYCGIYVKTFVLFFGEELRYYITEESANRTQIIEGSRITSESSGSQTQGRYHRINQILMSAVLWEDEDVLQKMKEYKASHDAAAQLFTIM